MKVKATRFDPAEILKTPEECAWFLTDALQTKDPAQIAHALGTLARAKGMREVAKKTGLSREGLYKILSDKGNPEIARGSGDRDGEVVSRHSLAPQAGRSLRGPSRRGCAA